MKIFYIILICLILSGCATLSELPRSAKTIDFSATNSGKTAMWTYEDSTIFRNTTKDEAFLAAKHALSINKFVVQKTSYEEGAIFGYHDMTLHDWNIVAGVYIKQAGSDIAVKVIAKTSKDFSLIGNIGDTTSGSWPQLIINSMRNYIEKEKR